MVNKESSKLYCSFTSLNIIKSLIILEEWLGSLLGMSEAWSMNLEKFIVHIQDEVDLMIPLHGGGGGGGGVVDELHHVIMMSYCSVRTLIIMLYYSF